MGVCEKGLPSLIKTRRKSGVAAAVFSSIQVTSIFDVVASTSYRATKRREKAQGRGLSNLRDVHLRARAQNVGRRDVAKWP